MICTCFGKTLDTGRLGDAARLMLGLPSYAAYAAHMRALHPEAETLTPAEFYHAAQSGPRLRCC